MGMHGVELIYWVCFFLGFGFAVMSGLLAGVFSGGGHGGLGHLDAGHGGHGGHAGADAGHGEGTVQFSPLSPVVLAMFIASFGGTGLILMKFLHWPLEVHLPVSALSGLAVGALVFAFFHKIFSVTQASSESLAGEMIGEEAEVTVPIPHQGLGEIAYTSRGARYTNPARTEDGKELPARTIVKIVKLIGTTYVVQKAR
ncbi:MAG TPA: NfeD family protein [Planctomycetota bacterium]|nr:NfeD family protein [Planctomycetota bacterium]